jgi:hypothetical protein
MPLVWLLHAENSTVLGHVIFGLLIARFPAYLPGQQAQAPAELPAAEQPGESARPDPDLS